MRVALAALLTLGVAAHVAAAPGVRLTMREGRVWLNADRAAAAQILAEWARVGDTQIVNADLLPSALVSLNLDGVPEDEALEIVLRSAGGYVAVSRPGAATVPTRDRSRFERITIVRAGATPPTATASSILPPEPVPVPSPPPVIFDASGAQRLIGPDGQPVPDDQEDAPPPRPATGSIPPGFSPQPEPPPEQIPPPPMPTAVPTSPIGVPRPGQIVAPPPPRRPGG
jgi:hypothetical protein